MLFGYFSLCIHFFKVMKRANRARDFANSKSSSFCHLPYNCWSLYEYLIDNQSEDSCSYLVSYKPPITFATGAHILIYFKHLSFLVYILRLTSYHIALKYKYLNYSYFGIRHIDLINSYKFRSKPHVYPNNVSSSSNTLL